MKKISRKRFSTHFHSLLWEVIRYINVKRLRIILVSLMCRISVGKDMECKCGSIYMMIRLMGLNMKASGTTTKDTAKAE